MDIVLGILLGLGLAASCGFRVFLPMLVTNIASLLGYLKLSSGFEWIGTWIAFAVFLTATIVEVGAYYIPWLDNALDTISTPLAMIAGTILTASFLVDVNPLIQWTLGIIIGGGSAGLVKVGASAARLTSSTTTGGAGNAVVATSENVLSVILSVLAILLPIVAAIIVFLIIFYFIRKFSKWAEKKNFLKAKKQSVDLIAEK